MRVRQPKRIIVVPSPIRSRGCAQIGERGREGRAIVIAIASPAKLRTPGGMRRLARVFEHEVLHTLGHEHEDMNDQDYWSLGPLPDWAKGMKIRYKGRPKSSL